MAHTVTALYDDFNSAQRAVEALVNAGFPHERISLIASDRNEEYARRVEAGDYDEGEVTAGDGAAFGAVTGALIGLGAVALPGIGPVIAAGPIASGLLGAGAGAVAGGAVGGVTGGLIEMGIDEDTAQGYAEGIRRGGTLVIAHTTDQRTEAAVEVMNRYDPVDMDRRMTAWRREGWERFDERAEPYTTEQLTMERDRNRHEADNIREEVVEEELQVGKRQVQSGSVRVRTHVTQKPVEETLHLRDEDVTVERRSVDRPASEADFGTGQETYELHEHHEEPVVSKEARVVEEVEVNKDVDTHTETVQETVRRKDVEVERGNGDGYRFADLEPQLRQHCKSTYGEGQFQMYAPAYRYGYTLANSDRYDDYNWQRVEPEARRNWERENQGTWHEVNDAVREAWVCVREG